MAKLVNPFNVATTDISQSEFAHVPAGDYKVIMFDSEVKPTKANDGGYVAAKYRIIEGEHTGSVLRTDIINVYNVNPVAARIGATRLAAIATAVGLGNATITDTEVLHNKPFMVRVTERDNTYVDKQTGDTKSNKQNDITTILGLDGKPPSKGTAQAQQPPQMAHQGGGLPTGTGMPPGFGQPAQQPQQAPQQPMQPAGGAPSWANPPMGNGMPPQPPQGQPAGNWGQPPAGAWGGPAQ